MLALLVVVTIHPNFVGATTDSDYVDAHQIGGDGVAPAFASGSAMARFLYRRPAFHKDDFPAQVDAAAADVLSILHVLLAG